MVLRFGLNTTELMEERLKKLGIEKVMKHLHHAILSDDDKIVKTVDNFIRKSGQKWDDESKELVLKRGTMKICFAILPFYFLF